MSEEFYSYNQLYNAFLGSQISLDSDGYVLDNGHLNKKSVSLLTHDQFLSALCARKYEWE